MRLTFNGGVETAILDLDRKNKILIVTSTKTNNKPVKAEWRNLFDEGKEEQQEKITDGLSDNLFITAIAKSMALNGYRLISKC